MEKYVIKKKIECPICNKVTEQLGLRKTLLKVINQDYDLQVQYEDIEPLFYGVFFCSHCGYANLTQNYEKPKEKKYSYENLFQKEWNKDRNIPTENSLDYSIKLHKLVLLNKTSISKPLNGEIGIVCLKLYYLYKLKKDEKEMCRFRKLSLDNLKKGYEHEEFPFGGMYNDFMVCYLIAIFSYYEGDIQTSKQWLSNLIKDTKVPYKLKEKARDFKEMYLK